MDSLPILSLIIFTPVIGILLLMFLDRRYVQELRQVALVISLVPLILSLWMLHMFQEGQGKMQLEEVHAWIPTLNIGYHLGIDGISVLLVLLTTFLTPVLLLSSWNSINKRIKEFQIAILLLEAAMIGVFLSLDLVLFYLFWEAMLIHMYILIGVWGGERRVYAAIKFFIYTMVGSLLMFLAILYLWFQTGSFDLQVISSALHGTAPLDASQQCWLFAAFALAFAIKVPLFPFHTWLPDAHVEAPTAGSVVLAGVLLKMGTYGFIRFAIPLFPLAVEVFYPWLCALSIIGIIFGAFMAWMQTDIKKLVAYSSVSHLGFVMLGIMVLNSNGLAGSVLQMINHGLSTSMLFLLVGIIYERRHTREVTQYGGLAKVMPVFSCFFMIATFSSIGLPGLNGFIGEFLILLGTFQKSVWLAVLAATGVILSAVYMLNLVKRFLLGPLDREENRQLNDVTAREFCYLAPFVVLIVFIGLYPKPFLNLIEPTVGYLLAQLAH
ncbi:MAG: NADH-quinone oxidoreductase subunit M [Planctomycetota bacterium]